jgi:hypothetical protein
MKTKFNEFKLINEDIAYHGSPYDFDYFSSNMIGEGEGASGWGYGFYFSADKGDAKGYAEKLEREKGEARLYQVRIPNKKMFFNLELDLDQQSDYVKERLLSMSDKYKIKILAQHNDFDYEEFKNDLDNTIDEYDFKKDDEEYIEYLKDTLNNEFMNIGNDFFDILKEIFDIVKYNFDGEYGASVFLSSLGIKGNIHNGFHILNYVVFKEEDITILKKTKPRF